VPDGSGFEDKAFVPAGPFDRDPGLRPALHLFAASKAPWWEIEDGLPQFDAFPPGIDAPVLPDRPPLDPPGGMRGSCLCGEVAYVASGPVIRMWLCHCSRCRRARAAAHNANMFVPLASLRFTRGAASVATFKPPDAQFFAQSFCTRCGSKMPRLDEARGAAVVPMGTLDDDPIERPSAHIYVGSKAPWYEIPGELPQYEERPA